MATQLKNLTDQIEDLEFNKIVGTVRSRIVDTNEYVADAVSPYITQISDQVTEQFNKATDAIEVPAFVSGTVEANRKFVSELVDAWTPAAEAPAPKKTAAKAKKTATKTAKKTTTKASAKK